jgi:hypothetical protein
LDAGRGVAGNKYLHDYASGASHAAKMPDITKFIYKKPRPKMVGVVF